MFQHPEGMIPGGGAFGDYVFNQEGEYCEGFSGICTLISLIY